MARVMSNIRLQAASPFKRRAINGSSEGGGGEHGLVQIVQFILNRALTCTFPLFFSSRMEIVNNK